MCKELDNIVQGYNNGDKINVEDTNTVTFLALVEITKIPKDRWVIDAHIIVNYCAQKDKLNRVHITIGGNLIKYPANSL